MRYAYRGDQLYRSHVELFERGVLPDMWFELMADTLDSGG